jgi:hypothetical protein
MEGAGEAFTSQQQQQMSQLDESQLTVSYTLLGEQVSKNKREKYFNTLL